MPFAKYASVIATSLQQLGDSRLTAIEAIENRHTIFVAVFARQDGSPTGGTDGIGDKAAIEPDALGS